MTDQQIELQIDENVRKILEKRHISEDEIKQVIEYGESGGDKLYVPDENRFLARLRIGEATFYAQYSIDNGKYVVHSAYVHKAEIKE
ncbi:MAG: hypothetical protein HYY30_08085 [Chloroflexi bacterium]|nr:hypothetical protein [Chloroflexota bacterium]